MTTGASLRELQQADLPSYRAFMLEGLAAHPDRFRLMPEDIDREAPPLAGEADGFTLVAEIDGACAGVVSVRREARHKCRHKALLYRMYVAEVQSGQGVGRLLLNRAIERARDIDGLRHLNLTVLADNAAARRLYESVGFADFALEPDAVFAAGRYRDEVQMKKVLPA